MILLRFLSILAGALVMLAPPLFLFSGTSAPAFFDTRTVLMMVAVLAAVAAIFFFIGVAGARMKRSASLRTLGAILLAVPFTASVAVLFRSHEADLLWLSGLLLAFTVMLFAMLMFPNAGANKHRALRARETRVRSRLARG